MPPDTIGQPGTLYLYRNHVEIVTKAGPRDAASRCARGVLSLLPEHRAAMLGAVRRPRPSVLSTAELVGARPRG